MKPSHLLKLALHVKSAATAPGIMAGTGGQSFMPGAGQPMASVVNTMKTMAQKNPLAETSMNMGNATGGMQAMLAARSGVPQASMLHNWAQQMQSRAGRAMF